MERKLAAILSADVCGYTRLVEDDDEATIRALHRHRTMMHDTIKAHHGRVVDSPGDNLLAEFASVVDAVRCAVEMQQSLKAANADSAPSRRMDFRMGITVGDVVVEDEKLYGNGVNIAARLESLAEPGGICLSGNAHEQIEGKLDLDARYDGEHAVKNVSKPVPVWRINVNEDGTAPESQATTLKSRALLPRGKIWPAPVAILIAAIAVAAFVIFTDHGSKPQVRTPESSTAAAATEFPRPAVIVLPFTNLSDDPQQDYFGYGIAEDIATDLSKLNGLFVVSANAASRYKGGDVDFHELNELFGVTHVVEGSVRRVADQVRISVRLVEVGGGQNLWGEHYDFPLNEIFAIQDEVRGKILTALRVKLSTDEQRRFAKAPTASLEAYDFYLRGLEASRNARSLRKPELMDEAVELFEKAIAIDPKYAAAYAAIGLTKYIQWFYGVEADDDNGIASFALYYEKAAALAPDDPLIQRLLLLSKMFGGDYNASVEFAEQLVSRYPTNAELSFNAAVMLVLAGHNERGLELLERAARYYPKLPPYVYYMYAITYHLLGRSEEARDLLREATLRSPQFLGNHLILAIVYDALDEPEKAATEATAILHISPEYRAQNFERLLPFKDKSLLNSYIAALRRAGLP